MKKDDTAFPTAPGTIAGNYNEEEFYFKNFRYNDIYNDLKEFREIVKKINPFFKMLLTVSPVPLNATASNDHVLVATIRSKSILRSVAGDFAEDYDDVFYFPSYEIISSHPSRGMFYQPNLREVNDVGVRYVMEHFFKSIGKKDFILPSSNDDNEIICDEEALEKFS
ncbi:GSCFA domain-containing protein [Vreelandella azerica]|uniref:GSCFA domain-containing protein n=1 Tax=Vreelandella azerica TaxID=2732867 RepID=UPI003BF48428